MWYWDARKGISDFSEDLLNVAIDNTEVCFGATEVSQKFDDLSFGMTLIKGVVETRGPMCRGQCVLLNLRQKGFQNGRNIPFGRRMPNR